MRLIKFLFIFLSINLASVLYSGDRQFDNLVRSATGISDQDLQEALSSTELTLFDAYALSVRNTETFKMECEKTIQAEARRDQAIGGVLPKFSLKGNYGFPNATSVYSPAGQHSNINLYGKLPISTGLDEWTKISKTRSELKLTEYELKYYAGKSLLDLTAVFYKNIQLQKSINNRKELLSLYNKTLGELQRRYAIGRSRESEQLRTRSEMYKIEASIKSLEKDLASARILLTNIIDKKGEFKLEEGFPIGEPEISQMDIRSIAVKRWDVKAAKENVDAAKANFTAAWGGHIPTVYLEGYLRLYSDSDPSNTLTPYGSLGFEVPIFNGGITVAKTREAESILRQADLNYKKILRTAQQEITDALQNYKNSVETARSYKFAMNTVKKDYYSIMNEYRLNLVTILDVLTSMSNLQLSMDDFEKAELQNRIDRVWLGIAVNEFPGVGIKMLKNKEVSKE